jgi:hypothetical protein
VRKNISIITSVKARKHKYKFKMLFLTLLLLTFYRKHNSAKQDDEEPVIQMQPPESENPGENPEEKPEENPEEKPEENPEEKPDGGMIEVENQGIELNI